MGGAMAHRWVRYLDRSLAREGCEGAVSTFDPPWDCLGFF